MSVYTNVKWSKVLVNSIFLYFPGPMAPVVPSTRLYASLTENNPFGIPSCPLTTTIPCSQFKESCILPHLASILGPLPPPTGALPPLGNSLVDRAVLGALPPGHQTPCFRTLLWC